MKTLATLLLLLVVALATTSALADEITFSFISRGPTDRLFASSPGLQMDAAQNIEVSDTNGLKVPFGGLDSASTGVAETFLITTAPNLVSASYTPGGPNSVLIEDQGKILLSGVMGDNGLLFSTYPNGAGAFLSVFHVTFVDPSILGLFGLGPHFNPEGSFSLTFAQTSVFNQQLDASVGGGSITIEASPIPEPSSLFLLGSGILGLAGLLRKTL